MADLRAYAAWLLEEAEIQGEAAVIIVSMDGELVVRYGSPKTAVNLCRRVLLELERPEGSTLQ